MFLRRDPRDAYTKFDCSNCTFLRASDGGHTGSHSLKKLIDEITRKCKPAGTSKSTRQSTACISDAGP